MQKLLRNKRGDVGGSLQQQLFLLAELVVGGLVIVGGIFLVTSQVHAAEGEPLAQDLALLISFMSHQTEDIAYSYLVPEVATSVSITQNEVIVNTINGRASARLHIHKNVEIQEKNFIDPQIIPIIFLDAEKTIFFETSELEGCTGTRLLDEEKKFHIDIQGTREEVAVLNRLNNFLNIKHTALDSNMRVPNLFEETHTSTKMEIKFNTENKFVISIPRNEPSYEAFRCYMQNYFEGEERNFNEIIIKENNEGKVIMKIGSYEEFSQKTPAEQEQILINYAKTIFNNLLRGRGN